MGKTATQDATNKTLKPSTILTPDWVAQYIYKSVNRFSTPNVLDIGCHNGNLSSHFRKKRNTKIIGLDVNDEFKNNFDIFIHVDFLDTTRKTFEDIPVDLIVFNAPFGESTDKDNKELVPLLWLKHCIYLWGSKMPIIAIHGRWMISNSIKRMKYLADSDFKITKTVALHKNTFSDCGVFVESDITYFNIKQKNPTDYLYPPESYKKQRFKSVAFSDDQMIYIKKNIDNFSGEIKNMIKKEFPDFPL
jgi:hypothetical protein